MVVNSVEKKKQRKINKAKSKKASFCLMSLFSPFLHHHREKSDDLNFFFEKEGTTFHFFPSLLSIKHSLFPLPLRACCNFPLISILAQSPSSGPLLSLLGHR